MKFYCEELLPEIESMLLNEYKKNFFCRLINFKKIKLLEKLYYNCIISLENLVEKE